MANKYLQATLPGVGDLEGGFPPTRPLAAGLPGTGLLESAFAVTKPLAGALPGVGDLDGEFTTPKPLSAALGGVGGVTSGFATTRPVRGVLAGLGLVSALVAIGHPLHATLLGTGDVSVALVSEDSQLDLQRAEYKHLREWNNKLSFVPLTGQGVFDGDGYLDFLFLSNVTGSDATVTITDGQGVPIPLLYEISILSGQHYVGTLRGIFCAGGLRWQASAALTVVGYVRVRR